MKRTLCLLLAMVLITALFAGCAPAVPETSGTTAPTTVPTQPTDPEPTDPIPTDPEPTNPTEPSQGTEPAEPLDIPFTYERIFAGFIDDSNLPCLYAIHSREQLDGYIAENTNNHSKLIDAVVKYDETFFADGTLLLITVADGTTSVDHEVKGIVQQPNGSYVIYLDVTYPLIIDTAYGEWHILIEVEDMLPEEAEFEITVVKILPDDEYEW